ncbi:hypothetical protein FACS1894204_05580 [Synergistales bacterium]|nr:hypothetical protein FACS1894204_05580 [Synergistales bacterium]
MKKIIKLRIVFQVSFVLLVFLRLHRTVYLILIFMPPLAFTVGNFFCGWCCPLGTFQDAFGKVGSLFIKEKIKIPPSVQRYAQYSKYLLALVLLILIVAGIIGAEEAKSLPVNAYQSLLAIFDRNPLMMSAIGFLVFILLLSFFVNRPFCNYLCVNSVGYALSSWTRSFTIKRKAAACINCKACDRSCPMNIQVSIAGELRNLQCINCFRCIAKCPVDDALSYGYGRADALLKN